MTNPNTNCLEGMACPKCESYGPFVIAVTATVTMHDDGNDGMTGDQEWDDPSSCSCIECDFTGTVKDFRKTRG